MSELKPSSYYYVTHAVEGVTLYFSFLTTCLIALGRTDAQLAADVLSRPNASWRGKRLRLRQMFTDKGFLIHQSIDELRSVQAYRLQAATHRGRLSLTIAPSLACNFRCVYCYETKTKQCMSRDVEAAVVQLVEHRLAHGGHLHITWFGGEPLLQLQTIERLSEQFLRICRDAEATYFANIITNGYLLDRPTARKLLALGVKRAQVTVDGPQEIHDARRPTARGGPTFERILRNLAQCHDILPISVRVNVDHTNLDRVTEFLDLLAAQGLRKTLGVYPGQTLPYTQACSDVSSQCLTDEMFALTGLELTMELVRRGFTASFHLARLKGTSCLADTESAFVVTPTGGIANCWNEVDNPSAEIGHLLKPLSDEMKRNQERWQCRDPFKMECADCLLLPICMGGCPYLYQTTGKLSCHPWKFHLDESLALYYYLQKLQQKAAVARELHDRREAGEDLGAFLLSVGLPKTVCDSLPPTKPRLD